MDVENKKKTSDVGTLSICVRGRDPVPTEIPNSISKTKKPAAPQPLSEVPATQQLKKCIIIAEKKIS